MKKLLAAVVPAFCLSLSAMAANPQVELKTNQGMIVI